MGSDNSCWFEYKYPEMFDISVSLSQFIYSNQLIMLCRWLWKWYVTYFLKIRQKNGLAVPNIYWTLWWAFQWNIFHVSHMLLIDLLSISTAYCSLSGSNHRKEFSIFFFDGPFPHAIWMAQIPLTVSGSGSTLRQTLQTCNCLLFDSRLESIQPLT